MSVLSLTEIDRRLNLEITEDDSLVITPRPTRDLFDADAIDLRLGTHFLLPQTPPPAGWASAQSAGHVHRSIHVPLGSYMVVPSHETVLGATLEFIKLPNDVSGQILTKSSVARNFMVIETAPWIHPLYRGCLTLEIANVSNTPLTIFPGLPIAQLVLLKNEPAEKGGLPHGTYLGPVYPEQPPTSAVKEKLLVMGISRFRNPSTGKWEY